MKRHCCFIRTNREQCKLTTKQENGLCHIHSKISSDKHQDTLRELEQTKIRLQEFENKMKIINQADWLRYSLNSIGKEDETLKKKLNNPQYKQQIESIFNLPIRRVKAHFFQTTDERNKICHPHTMKHIFKN